MNSLSFTNIFTMTLILISEIIPHYRLRNTVTNIWIHSINSYTIITCLTDDLSFSQIINNHKSETKNQNWPSQHKQLTKAEKEWKYLHRLSSPNAYSPCPEILQFALRWILPQRCIKKKHLKEHRGCIIEEKLN